MKLKLPDGRCAAIIWVGFRSTKRRFYSVYRDRDNPGDVYRNLGPFIFDIWSPPSG